MMDSIRKELEPFVRMLRPHMRRMALGTLLGLTAVAAAVGLLSLAGWFLTAAAVAGTTVAGGIAFNFFFPSIGVRIFAFTRTLARYGERIVCHDATFRILERLRIWCYRRIEPLAPAGMGHRQSGDLLNRLVEDVDTLDNLYLRVLSPCAAALVVILLVTGGLWWVEPVIAMTASGFLLAGGFGVSAVAGRMAMQTGRRLGQYRAGLHARIVMGLQGLSELLVYGADRRYMDAVDEESRRVMDVQHRMSRITGLSNGLMTLVSGFAVWTVLYIGVGGMEAGRLSGPKLALAVLAVLAAFEAVWPLPQAFQFLGRTREAGRRLLEITEVEPPVRFPEASDAEPGLFDLRFDAVRFGYPGTELPVLERVDFRVEPGRRIAILGPTGSGKSTLVHLLVRFWDPDAGVIRIGGQDIRTFREPDLRRYVTVISQQAHIFNATLRDNLLMARPDATETDLGEALECARIDDFVAGLPEGLDTWLGEGGSRLSGGQARRVAVARGFLHDAPIWVLDEPTEGLDRTTERKLLEAVLERTMGKTLLLITHRSAVLERMDEILSLESGRISIYGDPAS